MSNLNAAALALKTKISEIGEKEYFYSFSWLTSPMQPHNYTDNALQAVWNIADILHRATIDNNILSFIVVLGYNKSSLSRCFDYLEEETGTLKIRDIKTYLLGIAMQHLFHVLINDHKIKKLIPSKEFKNLEEIYTNLRQRVTEFQQHSMARFVEYKKHLELDLHLYKSPPNPDFIIVDTEQYEYNISFSTAEDDHIRTLEDKDKFINLIALLKKHEDELRQHESKLEEALNHFISNKHPLPKREEEVFYEEFSSARESTVLLIKDKHQKAKDERSQINILLNKAIAEHQSICDLLAKIIIARENEIDQTPITPISPISPLSPIQEDIHLPTPSPTRDSAQTKIILKSPILKKIESTDNRRHHISPSISRPLAAIVQAQDTLKKTSGNIDSKKTGEVKKNKTRRKIMTSGFRCNFMPPPKISTNIQTLETLKTTFFGNDPINIRGIFGDYLKERAETYWLGDLIEQFGCLLFGLFNYKTESLLRFEYILKLKEDLRSYQSNNNNYEALNDSITNGILIFHPRSLLRPEYQKSLHCKLFEFKHKLSIIHHKARSDNETLFQDINPVY